jgi:hypothetical protein
MTQTSAMNKLFICCFFYFFTFASFTALSQNDGKPKERLKVFIDCHNTWCDLAFIKTEIKIVDFLLDRLSADVHILVTSQNTGGGGKQYQIIFSGQNHFNTICDTIRYDVAANSMDAESRELLLKYLKLGMVPFITKTGLVSGVTIDMKQEPIIKIQSRPARKDRWNYWVITMNADGNISAEKAYKNYGYNGNISTNHITEEQKLGFSLYGGNSHSSYTFDNDSGLENFVAKNSYYGLQHYFIKSINKHWSAGYESIFSNSTFSNYMRQLYLRSALEYDIFPYREASNRFLTFSYGMIIRFNRYYDTTLYNKLKETLFAHSFRVYLVLNKKWGTVYSGISYSNFFHNWKLNNLSGSVNISVRITGGLSFYIYSSGGLVHDQVYLQKSGATEEEILTRLRQLKSSYYFQSRFGISYRFGSKLNNFVNPRFEGG